MFIRTYNLELSSSQLRACKPVTLCLVRQSSGWDLGGRWKKTHQDCRMSRPPSGGPPLPASCCRLFHWISSSSRMMVCCFLNSCSVFWCFSARSCTLTEKRSFDLQSHSGTLSHTYSMFSLSVHVHVLPVCISVVCWPLWSAMPPQWLSC